MSRNRRNARARARQQQYISEQHFVEPAQGSAAQRLSEERWWRKFQKMPMSKKILFSSISVGTLILIAFLLRNSREISSEMVTQSVTTKPYRSHSSRTSSGLFEEKYGIESSHEASSSSGMTPKALRKVVRKVVQEKIAGQDETWKKLIQDALQQFLNSVPPELHSLFVTFFESQNFAGFYPGVEDLDTGEISLESPAYTYCLPTGQIAITFSGHITRGCSHPAHELSRVFTHELLHAAYCFIQHRPEGSPFTPEILNRKTARQYLSARIEIGISDPGSHQALQEYFQHHEYLPAVYRQVTLLQDLPSEIQTASVQQSVAMRKDGRTLYVTDVQEVVREESYAISTYTVVNPTHPTTTAQERLMALLTDLKFLFPRSKSLTGPPDQQDAELFANFVQIAGFEPAKILAPELMAQFVDQMTADHPHRSLRAS